MFDNHGGEVPEGPRRRVLSSSRFCGLRILKSMLGGGLVAACLAVPAEASVVIAGTRVVYHAKDQETTLKLSNEGKAPALVQAWVDNGDIQASPTTLDVPFTVTPPLSRIDPAKAQTLRIVYSGEALPQDRESVFWLNVLELAPKPEDPEINALQLAFRSRIKLFFRPSALKGRPEEAASQLSWRLDGQQLEVSNPTPFHVSLIFAEVRSGGGVAKFDAGEMVGPGQRKVLPLNAPLKLDPGAKVHYRWLNDYGGAVDGEAKF